MMRVDEVRVTGVHLKREAIVYVRQSTAKQVKIYEESTRVQLGLRERAISLGWRNPLIVDDDLGVSAAGYADRPGFQSLMSRVALRQIGIILCVDASRLSRNSKDWAELFELCGHFDTLIADLDQIYNLQIPNDRLVLGIKGTVSELELSILRTRLRTGAEQKAARGELKMLLPPGYAYDSEDQLVFAPDRRVQAGIRLMFDQFDRAKSVRQLALWYKDTHTVFPIQKIGHENPIRWEIPTSKGLRKLLLHPIYAGAYVYGRRTTRVEYQDGSLRKHATECLPPEQARVFIRDHHPAYISWERFCCNRQKIAQNRPRWKMFEHQGAIRDGLALLAGLLRCGRCGRRIYVGYKARSALYYCDGGPPKGSRRCVSFGSNAIDKKVAGEVVRALSPLAVEASLAAEQELQDQQEQECENARLRVQASQYEVDRAFEQFDAVDPKNRLVADTLEGRLNEKLQQLEEAKRHLEGHEVRRTALDEDQRRKLEALAEDFPSLWNHPEANATLKKRILRTVLEEVIVTHDVERSELDVVLHWKGSVHTRVRVAKKPTLRGNKADPSLVDLTRELARTLGDAEIARILNMKKMRSPRGLLWTQSRVQDFRRYQRIHSPNKACEGQFLTGQQAMESLGVSRNALFALLRRGAIHNGQVTDFAPWRIDRNELESDEVQELVAFMKKHGRFPKGGSPRNQPGLFDANKGLTPEV